MSIQALLCGVLVKVKHYNKLVNILTICLKTTTCWSSAIADIKGTALKMAKSKKSIYFDTLVVFV